MSQAHDPNRSKLEISDKTKVRVNVYAAASICATIAATGFLAAQKFDAIIAGQTKIEVALKYKLSTSQFSAWAVAMERANRITVPALIVPDPLTLPSHPISVEP